MFVRAPLKYVHNLGHGQHCGDQGSRQHAESVLDGARGPGNCHYVQLEWQAARDWGAAGGRRAGGTDRVGLRLTRDGLQSEVPQKRGANTGLLV